MSEKEHAQKSLEVGDRKSTTGVLSGLCMKAGEHAKLGIQPRGRLQDGRRTCILRIGGSICRLNLTGERRFDAEGKSKHSLHFDSCSSHSHLSQISTHIPPCGNVAQSITQARVPHLAFKHPRIINAADAIAHSGSCHLFPETWQSHILQPYKAQPGWHLGLKSMNMDRLAPVLLKGGNR